jgi:hypothetical protein
MSVRQNAKDLFDFIADVYSIDLPVVRDVLTHQQERWWIANLPPCSTCRIKQFNDTDGDEEGTQDTDSVWLSATKTACDKPPHLPEGLSDWVDVPHNPSKRPIAKLKLVRRIQFDASQERVNAYDEYRKAWIEWDRDTRGDAPIVPEACKDWLDNSQVQESLPFPLKEREVEERFADEPVRVGLLNKYVDGQWTLWSERTLRPFRANELYDELFTLQQRLSVEGDRWEIICGHLFLCWQHSPGQAVYHPLLITPLSLEFLPESRTLTLKPIGSTKVELECLRGLEFDSKEYVLALARQINESEALPNPWSHNVVRGLAATVSGYLSKAAQSETDRYEDPACSKPSLSDLPVVYNAPIIFVRERPRHFWIEDARSVADRIAKGSEIPAFIQATVRSTDSEEAVNGAADNARHDRRTPAPQLDEDDKELYFPLLHNDQQKEICDRLRVQFGVLVQGPPGTGKSQTSANIICDHLARGAKVLVTSQTENALRVLRQLIPAEIRSLCVSHLGNDTESKKQLHEAVISIGEHLSEKGSRARVHHVGKLKEQLQSNREEQALHRNRIREWAQLDAEQIAISAETLSASQAAKEIAENEKLHSWLLDTIMPDVEPPLQDIELEELASLFKEVSSEDRRVCADLDLPEVPTPTVICTVLREMASCRALADQTETIRSDWSPVLNLAEAEQLDTIASSLEVALSHLGHLTEPWQHQFLALLISNECQVTFWSNAIASCEEFRENAFKCLQAIQGHEFHGLSDLDLDIEWSDVLYELEQLVEEGKDPGKFFNQLRMSRSAKHLFSTVRVNDRPLSSKERISALKHRFSYESYIKKVEFRWQQNFVDILSAPARSGRATMPLADIDGRLKKAKAVVEWHATYLISLRSSLTVLGCPLHKQLFHRKEILTEHLEAIHGRWASVRCEKLCEELNQYKAVLRCHTPASSCKAIVESLADALHVRSHEQYETAYAELIRLIQLRPKVRRLNVLLESFKKAAPNWAEAFESAAILAGSSAIPKDWRLAWRWQRLNQWLNQLHSRETVEQLQTRLERLGRDERYLITRLVVEQTWLRQIERVEDSHYTALAAWAAAMKNYGKGTGKYAQQFLAAAERAMIDAVKAVPVWVMPLYRVVQSFPAEPELFDLVIIDEASQCDIRAFPVLFRAKKVLVVGDPEQISPSNVGMEKDKVFELLRLKLPKIPHPERFMVQNSLFAITQTIPGLTRTMLTEHFRCVPEIIEFNNSLCPTYAGKLEPLRQVKPCDKLHPPLAACFVPNGHKNNSDINPPEAEALVEALLLLCKCRAYENKTIGVISLLGEKQAQYISSLLAGALDERERAARRIICGDAYAFQGDERDVMFLSMVVAGNAPYAPLVKEDARQRFNVAASRARDQVFLFHSVQMEDLQNENCVRHKMLKWYLNPPIAETEASREILRQKADSPFEIEVGEAVIKRGYKVMPQYRPFQRDYQYRIDLLVHGPKGRLAIECDGDRWHGPERWEYDQRREAQLRRAGLRFWRLSGSVFYRNKAKALESLWPILVDSCG